MRRNYVVVFGVVLAACGVSLESRLLGTWSSHTALLGTQSFTFETQRYTYQLGEDTGLLTERGTWALADGGIATVADGVTFRPLDGGSEAVGAAKTVMGVEAFCVTKALSPTTNIEACSPQRTVYGVAFDDKGQLILTERSLNVGVVFSKQP